MNGWIDFMDLKKTKQKQKQDKMLKNHFISPTNFWIQASNSFLKLLELYSHSSLMYSM